MRNELVFKSDFGVSAQLYTTSGVIAECAHVKHHAVQVLIQKYESDLKEFGQVSFEMRAVTYSRGTNQEKIYHLNEQQATLILTYLKNTETVRAFKKNLVKQFFQMRAELTKRKQLRSELKPAHQELTDAVHICEGSGTWDYCKYENLAYISALGKNAKTLRKERDAPPKSVAKDFLRADELAAVSQSERQIAVLLGLNLDYHQIKALLIPDKKESPLLTVQSKQGA